MKLSDTPKQYQEIYQNSQLMNETNDCAVIALSLTCGIDYQEAHKIFKECGRKDRQGAFYGQIRNAFIKAGFHMNRLYDVKAKTVTSLKKEKIFSPAGRYLVLTATHALAMHGNQVLDWTADRRHRVSSIYEIVKAEV